MKWLLLDGPYLFHRAYYSTGTLAYKDEPTGTLFGFLKAVTSLQDQFLADRLVFCFDCGLGLRVADCPGYKASRRNKVRKPQEQQLYEIMQSQMRVLRRKYLKQIGFANVLYEAGYEADDIIAAVINQLPKEDTAVIISSDHDLYQLLSERVFIYNPHAKKAITQESFEKEWGVSPTQWIDVKAIAGCHTDDIPGIKGIGEKTAAKFINGTLKPGCEAFNKIVKGNKVWKKNRHLVRLPYPGLAPFSLSEDKVTTESWNAFTDQFGMKSIRDIIPTRRSNGEGKRERESVRKERMRTSFGLGNQR